MRPASRSSRARIVRALLLGVAVSLAVTVVSRAGALGGWETRAVDAFVFFRDRAAAPEVAMVVIDEDAFRELGERQPLPRRYLADLADLLLRSGARVVVFDIHFAVATTAEDDEALVALARRRPGGGGRLVFATVASSRPGTAPPAYDVAPLFSAELAGPHGFANAPAGADGIIRWMAPALPSASGGFHASLALAAVAAHGGVPAEALGEALRSGGTIALPVSGAYSPAGGGGEPVSVARLAGANWRVDFVGPAGSITAFPSGPLVALARSGVRPEAANPFNGRIVLVGAAFRDSRDLYATPVGLMPGVEIHANIVHTLLSRRSLLPPSPLLNGSLLVAVCLTVALLSVWLRPLWAAAAAAVIVATFATVSYEAYTRGGYWLDFVAPVVGMMAYLQGARVLARRRLRLAFGQFVSPQVMDRVVAEGAALGGEVRTVSVLMSDLRGFTTLSERLSPREVSETMNEYFTAMVDVILEHRGMVQDFIGDGILAVFGAPLDDPDHAWHAVETALGMQAALGRLNPRWQAAGRAPLAMGAAVHTGPVFAGTMGSPRKKKYAVLGDTVNTASRIEGLNRELSTDVLLSGATLAAVSDRVRVRERGAFAVKGRAQPVEVFELIGAAAVVPAAGRT